VTRHEQEPGPHDPADETRVVIPGVAASDSHAVANQLIMWGSITGSGLDGLPGWDHR
jgi:hypothetical protein